jgi:hypothetical protein
MGNREKLVSSWSACAGGLRLSPDNRLKCIPSKAMPKTLAIDVQA